MKPGIIADGLDSLPGRVVLPFLSSVSPVSTNGDAAVAPVAAACRTSPWVGRSCRTDRRRDPAINSYQKVRLFAPFGAAGLSLAFSSVEDGCYPTERWPREEEVLL